MEFEEIEKKWQKRWFNEKIYEARKEKGKKFFIHFAYPGISGYLHVGHMRGFTYSDIIARYKRMSGYDVIFPAGFHATGLPAVSLAKKVERGDEKTLQYLRSNGCPEEIIKKLSDPIEVVKYFSNVYVEEYWKKFGFLIDYTRLMDTISPGYKKFIQWQFYKLKELDLLTQKPHYAPYCPNCGPVAVDKSETDISQGGDAEILEFTLIKFKMDGYILPAATLRPETIFGVTNMWVNGSEDYVIAKVGNEKWIVSEKAAFKLKHQMDDVEIIEKIKGSKLVGKKCVAPLIEKEVPIYDAKFVDTSVATGVVMSVPAHAPYDYVALRDMNMPVEPIVIIKIKGYEIPAKEIVEKMGIKDQHDERLEEATQIIYKEEFHSGIMNENCMEYAGRKINEVKDEIKEKLLQRNEAAIMREFSKKVICRCGAEVIIKKIPDQWFIRYSDEELTEKSNEHVKSMNIYPSEYKEELPKVLDWFGDRACIRRGSWLGTEFPFKKGWVVEPISDSTLYPAYYIISKYVNSGEIKPEEMSNDFFDYVFLGKGKAKNETWKKIRDDFLYWYPVDINLGGKEHKTVHFPVFIMNHVAIMEKQHWPRGIFVNWWVTQQQGEKISKSKGGAEPIPGASKKYGVDTMRLYYAHAASPFVDVEWNGDAVEQYKKRLIRIWNFFEKLIKVDGGKSRIDEWLISAFNKELKSVEEAMKEYEFRKASNSIYFNVYSILQWYIRRGGGNKDAIRDVVEKWIKAMAPFTPHIAEEMWEKLGKDGFVSLQEYPEAGEINEEVLINEELLIKTINDIEEIKKVTKIQPKKVFIYVAPQWKWKIVEIANELKKEGKLNMKNLMAEAKKIGMDMKKASKYAAKLIEDMKKMEFKRVNEFDYLKEAKEFIEKEIGCEVEIMDENATYDPASKKEQAMPLRPAIYIES